MYYLKECKPNGKYKTIMKGPDEEVLWIHLCQLSIENPNKYYIILGR